MAQLIQSNVKDFMNNESNQDIIIIKVVLLDRPISL
jgi:hypothetical protein